MGVSGCFIVYVFIQSSAFVMSIKTRSVRKKKKKHCSERVHFCDAWVSCRNLRQCEKGKIMQASTRLEMVVINDAKYVYFVGTVDDVLFFFFVPSPSILQWNDVTGWTGVIQLCSVLYNSYTEVPNL